MKSPNGLQAIRREQARRDFRSWLEQVTPVFTWDWQHLAYIRMYLDKVTSGEIKRLMLFVPPRHGKSEQVTIRYPVWRMEREPHLRVIVGAYNQFLANKFARAARRIALTRLNIREDRKAVDDWETEEGGGYRAVGVGAGITGQGGHIVIIDDPVKSREEANSPTYRERVWDWYTNDLYTRLEPGASIVLIMTRWHTEDLAGRILANEGGPEWTVITLPALAEESDPLGREVGKALCPERYNETALADIREVVGSRDFSALYQQRPYPAEGALFKRDWFQIVDEYPRGIPMVRFWDMAATLPGRGKDPSYTVGLMMAKGRDNTLYITDVRRTRDTPLNIKRLVRQTAELDGYGVPAAIEHEGGSSGKAVIDDYIRTVLFGYSCYGVYPKGDKVERARPLSAMAEAGNVKLVRGEWNRAFLDEIEAFPFGAHEDQVDAASGAYHELAATSSWSVSEY